MYGDRYCLSHGYSPCNCYESTVHVSPGLPYNVPIPAPSFVDYSEHLKSVSESLCRLVTLMEARSDRTLQGWKEIADYLGMSVSRAKRLGSSGRRDRMPVYSFHGRVYAKPTALDRWRTDSSVAVGVG